MSPFFRTIGHSHILEMGSSVNDMNTSVSRRESFNRAAEPGRDLLETGVVDDTKSVRAKNRGNPGRLETAHRAFINFLEAFGPLRFQLPQLF